MAAPFLFTNMTLDQNLKDLPNVFDELPGNLTNKNQWISVFDNLLLTGSNGPGWTKQFQDNDDKVVYQPADGPQFSARFEWGINDKDNIGLRIYESMTDVDTGANETPTASQKIDTYSCIYSKFNTSITRNLGWILIADESMFILANRYNEDHPNYDLFVVVSAGQFSALNPAEAYNVFNGAGRDNTFSGIRPNGGDIEAWHTFRDEGNSGSSRRIYAGAIPTAKADSSYYLCGYNGGLQFPDPATGGLVMNDIWLSSDGDNGRTVRGKLPGFIGHLHDINVDLGLIDGLGPTLIQGTGDYEGRNIIGIKVLNPNRDHLFISLEDWRE